MGIAQAGVRCGARHAVPPSEWTAVAEMRRMPFCMYTAGQRSRDAAHCENCRVYIFFLSRFKASHFKDFASLSEGQAVCPKMCVVERMTSGIRQASPGVMARF